MAMLRVGPEGTQSPSILSQDTGMKPGGSGQGQRKVGGCRYREGHPKADSYGMYSRWHPCVRTGKRLLAEVLDWKGPGLVGGRTELMRFHKVARVKKDGSGRKWSSPLGISDCSFIHSANVNSMPVLCQVLGPCKFS